jgi:hypothetical protein
MYIHGLILDPQFDADFCIAIVRRGGRNAVGVEPSLREDEGVGVGVHVRLRLRKLRQRYLAFTCLLQVVVLFAPLNGIGPGNVHGLAVPHIIQFELRHCHHISGHRRWLRGSEIVETSFHGAVPDGGTTNPLDYSAVATSKNNVGRKRVQTKILKQELGEKEKKKTVVNN